MSQPPAEPADGADPAHVAAVLAVAVDAAPVAVEEKPKPAARSRTRKPVVKAAVADEATVEPVAEAVEKPKRSRAKPKAAPAEVVVAEAASVETKAADVVPESAQAAFPQDPAMTEAPLDEPKADDGPPKPKRKGWWSLGR